MVIEASGSKLRELAGPRSPVARLVIGYRMPELAIEKHDVVRAARAVSDALEDLRPSMRIYGNRPADDAIALLRTGGEISTIFTSGSKLRKQVRDAAQFDDYIANRKRIELQANVHGDGVLAGRTVYGTLQFADYLHGTTTFASRGAAAAEAISARRPTRGWAGAGPVSFVYKPETLERATFLPGDLYKTRDPIASIQHLPEVVLRNLAHSHGAVPQYEVAGPSHADARAFARVLRSSADTIKRHTQRHLQSATMEDHYIEAQIRGASLDDVERIVVDAHPSVITPSNLRELKRLAKRRGIPIDVVTPATATQSGAGTR